VIAALGGTPSAQAAKAATATIPIVFAAPQNPVELGLVASLSRPGGNVTGMTGFTDELMAKRLALLHEFVPRAAAIGFLTTTAADREAKIRRAAANTLGIQLPELIADTEGEVEAAFASFARLGVGALLVGTSAAYISWREQIIALAARYRIPASYHRREYVEIGGLTSYGANIDDSYRQAGVYVGRILKGDRPRDLPVMQPSKFELVINLKTAKTLGLAIPETLLATANEVIQ
jgi:putative tryptophan/tyrosine transport system substrate-binding protein